MMVPRLGEGLTSLHEVSPMFEFSQESRVVAPFGSTGSGRLGPGGANAIAESVYSRQLARAVIDEVCETIANCRGPKPGKVSVLGAIASRDWQSTAEVAFRSSRTELEINPLLDALEEVGIVERAEDPPITRYRLSPRA